VAISAETPVNEIDKALARVEQAGSRLSHNDRRIIGGLLADMARRDGIQPQEILEWPEIETALNDKRRNGPQKTTVLKQLLRASLLPTYTRAEQAFTASVAALCLHPKIKVEHSPYFEDMAISVSFKYRDKDELRAILESLKKLEGIELIKNALEAATNSD
jgi:hypothetical protein